VKGVLTEGCILKESNRDNGDTEKTSTDTRKSTCGEKGKDLENMINRAEREIVPGKVSSD